MRCTNCPKDAVTGKKMCLDCLKRYSDRMAKTCRDNRDRIFAHYGAVCNCCGEKEPKFLSIDHVNNDGYLDKDPKGRRLSARRVYYKIIREKFPNTYQVLCMNCNHGKSRNGGVCPHQETKV